MASFLEILEVATRDTGLENEVISIVLKAREVREGARS